MAVAGLCRPFSRQGAAAGARRRACRCLHAVRTLEDGGRSSASQLSSRWCSRATASSAASTCFGSGTFRSASMTWKPRCKGISATDRTRPSMLLDRFERWDRATLDLPGAYYLEVTDRVFPAKPDRRRAASSRSAAGSISPRCACRSSCWRERTTSSSRAIRRSPRAPLLGTRPAWLERACEPCGHLSLFMGRSALGHSWRRIARWLQADIGDAAGARISA